jgi:hypothetical protein
MIMQVKIIVLLKGNTLTVLPHLQKARVPARISKGQGAGPEKGHFSALLDFQKRHVVETM